MHQVAVSAWSKGDCSSRRPIAWSCASYKTLEGRQARPQLASIALCRSPRSTCSRVIPPRRVAVGELLERGFIAFHHGRIGAPPTPSPRHRTGSLNDPGRPGLLARSQAERHLATRTSAPRRSGASSWWHKTSSTAGRVATPSTASATHRPLRPREPARRGQGFLAAIWAKRAVDFGHSWISRCRAERAGGEAFINLAPPARRGDRDVRRE